MFWKKKDKGKAGKSAENSGKMTREEIIAQAKKNASAARAEIGDETLEKIKQAMLRKQLSALEQAKTTIKNADQGKVQDYLKYIMREDKGDN